MALTISLDQMVDEFITEKKASSIDYLEDLKQKGKKLSYGEFIRIAVSSFPEHKWNYEKYHKEESLKEVALNLKAKEKQILNSKTFDELLIHIDDIKVKDFGVLAKYDTALSFGLFLGLLPDKIFLHAGPEKAAKHIFGNKYRGTAKHLRRNRIPYIDVKDFPAEFNQLKPMPFLIEDCLCFIYQRYLDFD